MISIIFFIAISILQFIAPVSSEEELVSAITNGPCGKLKENQLYNRGRTPAPSEYPWMGRIIYTENVSGNQSGRCVATLFSERHVLAPAHCVMGNNHTYYAVVFDENVDAAVSEEYLIDQIAVHENYSLGYNDIAVLKLAKDVAFSDYIQPICLPPRAEVLGAHIGQRLDVVGLPVDFYPHWTTRRVRIKAEAHTSSKQHCSSIVGHNYYMTITQICAFVHSDKPLMSGSALMDINVVNGEPRNYYLVGLLSQGSKDMMTNDTQPDFFTRIWPYRQWILNKTNNIVNSG